MWEYYYPDCLEYSDDLYHHGTKGMKWGVRRYQNKDGSLTAAGKKRRSLGQVIRDHKTKKKRKAALEKAREAKAAKKKAEEKAKVAAEKRQKALEKGRLSTRKMTDEELKAYKTRLQTEKDIKDLVMETRPMKRLMSKMWSDAIVTGATKAGAKIVEDTLTKYANKALGLNAKSALDAVLDEQKLWEAKRKIKEDKDKLKGDKPKSEYEKLKEDAEMAKLRKQKFENERDLAESQKKYQKHLDDEKFANDEVARRNSEREYESYKNEEPYRKKGAGSHAGSSDNVASGTNYPSVVSNNTKSVSTGREVVQSSKANSTALSTVRNSESTQKAQAWVEDSRTGEILRNTTVKIDEDD